MLRLTCARRRQLRASTLHPTEDDAIASARDMAINQLSEVAIHRPNGRLKLVRQQPYLPRGCQKET
ncbi:DUF2188 domain-containing protein [Rhizobium laguerreae]|nr:DUF2188 domain-containing protein [Rhizobium laguerreae]MBY3148818.1 DUF2188 domain-containing protein [Rhizobium laguerreae]